MDIAACVLIALLLPLGAMLYLDVLEVKNEAKQQLEKVEKLRREIEQKERKKMTKQLEKNSEFNKFDTDHDGVVTDAELARSERMITIENMDKMADQQRIMAWAALVAPPFIIAYMASEFVTLEKVNALNGLATTYCAAMGTIVVAFMAAQAYVRGKAEG